MFALATRVFGSDDGQSELSLSELKDLLRAYEVTDESLAPLKLCVKPLDLEPTHVTFGVNTSGLQGADFWLTITKEENVFYSDGMDENDVLLQPMYSES